jgi:trehalose synthase
VRQVEYPALRPDRFSEVLDEETYAAFASALADASRSLDHRRLWHVNSTASGGGVAEILRPLAGYQRYAGWAGGWLALDGDDEFFAVTKRIHNRLHGQASGGDLGDDDRRVYERVLERELEQMRATVRPGDVVVLHDPQTLGLASGLARAGVEVLWVCHIGVDEPNDVAESAQSFLWGYLDDVRTCVFSRTSYVWGGVGDERVRIVPPAIDPFAPKNQPLDDRTVEDVLRTAGVVDEQPAGDPSFERADGSRGRIGERVETIEDASVALSAPAVVQVSRWDRLKDHAGVLRGFAEHVPADTGAHLLLVGPRVDGVSDDPEQSAVLREIVESREGLDSAVRERTHIVCMPSGDVEAGHAVVNAVQRHASVVVQKSLAEGFGLTVAEGMWKARPVVATRVGGIQDQIEDDRSGLLIDDPRALDRLGGAVTRLLGDPALAERIGRNARERVRDRFLLSRYLAQLAEVVDDVGRDVDLRPGPV